MRGVLAPVFLAGLFAFAGLGILHAIRPFALRPLRASGLNLVAALGLAYLVGVAVVVAIAIGLLVAGIALSLPAFAVLALGVGGSGIAIGILRETEPPAPTEGLAATFPARVDTIVVIACAVLFGGFALLVLPMFTSAPTVEWDSWSIWARKAVALYQLNTLEPAFWTAKPYAFQHQDYPILLPMLENLHFRVLGRIDTQSDHVQFWLLFLAFPWAVGYLVARAGRAAVWAPIVLGAAVAPAIAGVIIGGLADVPVMLFVGAGILALGLWVDTRDRFYLAVAIPLLVGAASTKNEGLLAAVVALFMAGVVVFRDRPRRPLRDLGAAAGVFVLMVAPWQLWAAASGVPKDVNAGDGLNPLYLAKHLDRAWPAFRTLQAQLADQSKWSYFVPLAVVMIIAAIVVRTATRTAVFYALTGVGIYAALVWAYWASLYPIDVYLAQSAFRVVDGLGAVAMVSLAHLGARLAGLTFAPEAPPAPPDGEVATLESGEREEIPKRTPVPAGLLALWRA